MMLKERIISLTALAATVLTGGLLWATGTKAPADWQGRVHPPSYKEAIFPPWSGGKNNSAVNKGFKFTVP